MLYLRQLVALFINLYTVRLVLELLGVEDYGIYAVIGGLVTILSFLSATMASATQRFFSFALGQNDLEKLKRLFSTNVIIYSSIALIGFVLLESVGLWYVENYLNLPIDRFESAKFLFHFSVLTFISTIIMTPFLSIIIAHEDMQIYAFASIAESIMKLSTVFVLMYTSWDNLEAYGVLLFIVSILITVSYISICMNKYLECQFRKLYWDKNLVREVLNFTGWTLFGAITTVGRNQAITILINQYFNPTTVAARAISNSITNQVIIFSANFNVGLYPPIIKKYSSGDRVGMFSLISNGSKITFFLMWVLALPLFIQMDVILSLWLKNPPPEAVLFTRLALIEAVINSISLPIATAARAPGKMKLYELTLGSIQVLIFIAAWTILEMGGAAYYVYVVAISANVVMFIVRLLIIKALIEFPLQPYVFRVFLPILSVALFSSIPSVMVYLSLSNDLISFAISVFSCVMFSSVSMYFLGLDRESREKIRMVIIKKINRELV
ncbi:polysaccharide biosynthesis protein [Vibrio splendidus]|nr:polysaccharide biosynthesis protein [Vibrio splendidus]